MTMSVAHHAAPEDQPLTFGIFDWVDGDPRGDTAAVYDGRLEMVRAADRGSIFERYHVAEHHGTALGMAPSPAVYMAAVARVTERIRLAPTTFVVPLYDPLRLVQEIAMLDNLSHGRLDVGVGPGAVLQEVAMYGEDMTTARARFNALTPGVLEALETGVYRPGQGLEGRGDVELAVTTVQKPLPPLWYPTTNAPSVPRLGTEGYNAIFGFAWLTPPAAAIGEASRTYFRHLKQAREGGGARYLVPGRTPRFGTMKHVFVAPTDAEAIDTARSAMRDFNARFTFLWRNDENPVAPLEIDFDQLLADSLVLVGSPDTVVERLTGLISVGRLNYFAGVFAWGSLEQQAVLRSLQLFETEVAPRVREATEKQAAGLFDDVAGL
jgi:alkanesulfonate monooxygenase SsuD/methylene tetrahydromethanopterin reductase-like flavin-dependent oxidoreductase (luciferase family)